MSDAGIYSAYAVLSELNAREFKRKIALFPEEQRYYVVLAGSIIGAANAARLGETPEAVVKDGEEFSSKLLEITDPADNEAFREVLEACLIETIKDELSCCCQNCRGFNSCIDMENLEVGQLFRRRAHGEETPALKAEIALQVAAALKNTPYTDTDIADRLCGRFTHQYSLSGVGQVFGRYAEIAAELQRRFGIDYLKIQQAIIRLNMDFAERNCDPGINT